MDKNLDGWEHGAVPVGVDSGVADCAFCCRLAKLTEMLEKLAASTAAALTTGLQLHRLTSRAPSLPAGLLRKLPTVATAHTSSSHAVTRK